MMGVRGDGIRFQLKRIQFGQPSFSVRCKDRVRLSLLRQHFVAFQQHVVFVRCEIDALGAKPIGDLGIPNHGRRVVVVIGEHLVHP